MLGVIPPLGMLKVTLPVPALTANPEPATALNTPRLPIALLMMEMPVPAVSEVCAPGKVCPAANVTRPLLAIERPVSAGALPSEKKRRFNEPEGLAVLLPTASAFHRKSWFTAKLLPLLKADA